MGGGVVYDPSLDTRTQTVLENCVLQGTDPTSLGIIASGATTPVYSVEVLTGVGRETLTEEKSESWTAGFSWTQPFWSSFDLTLGATYYEVEIVDEIIELFSQTSIDDCYNDAENDSTFCENISRADLGGGLSGLITEVDEAFLNRDSLKTRGVDINLAVDWPTDFTIAGRPLDIGADFTFNRKLEFSDLFISTSSGAVSKDSDLGQFGYPEWEGQGIARFDVGNFRFTWSTRYIGSVRIDPDVRADLPFGNVDTEAYNTCLGPQNGDLDCRPVGEADNYFRHDMSFYYYGDVWTVGAGVRNVTDEFPPLVDGRAQFSGWNVPFGAGYDINGRQYFLNVAARFDNLTF
jgi:iron complex outermembrane receptor protein